MQITNKDQLTPGRTIYRSQYVTGSSSPVIVTIVVGSILQRKTTGALYIEGTQLADARYNEMVKTWTRTTSKPISVELFLNDANIIPNDYNNSCVFTTEVEARKYGELLTPNCPRPLQYCHNGEASTTARSDVDEPQPKLTPEEAYDLAMKSVI